MRGLTFMVTITLLAAGSLAAAAADRPDPLSVRFQVGVGMNTGNAPAYDYLSTAGMVGGELHYRLNKNVSLVPASLSFYFYSGSPAASRTNPGSFAGQQRGSRANRGSVSSYVDPWINPSYYNQSYYYNGGYYGYGRTPSNLAWGVSMTPGIKFQTAGRQLFNFYAQVGAGVYRHNQKSSSYYGVGRLSNTSLAASGEAGVEVIAFEQVNVVLGGGYMWVHGNPAFGGIVHLNMGFRVGF